MAYQRTIGWNSETLNMKKEIIAIIHNVRSVHNVGSMFRTADAAGISKLYLTGFTPSPLNRFKEFIPQFSKVALGAEKTISWEKVDSPGEVIKKLKKENFKILALEQSSRSISYSHASLKKYSKIAIVVGNEVKGLSPSLLKAADRVIEIPMHGEKESLNVGVAFGIAVFALRE